MPHRDPASAETIKIFSSAGTAVAGENCRDTWNKNKHPVGHVIIPHFKSKYGFIPV